jgi:malonyl-CoA decarboxylase
MMRTAEGEANLLTVIKKGAEHPEIDGKVLQQPLIRLGARYLMKARKGRQALDRVAHFHLTNGARIEQINWAADLSDKGLQQSAGLMVNYLYKLPDIEKNHEIYSGQGEIVVSSGVRRLL